MFLSLTFQLEFPSAVTLYLKFIETYDRNYQLIYMGKHLLLISEQYLFLHIGLAFPLVLPMAEMSSSIGNAS
jgi:hypothetical protein